MSSDDTTIKISDLFSGEDIKLDNYYTTMADDNTVTITTSSDSITLGDSIWTDFNNSGWQTIPLTDPEIRIGNTTLTEKKLNDLLTLLDMIENMPANSGIKKLFNAHKAIRNIGGNSDQTESN